MTTLAVLSEDRVYRYWLMRRWDVDKPPALFVMLNPSTADADTDDATVRKCMGFARRWGCGGVEVVNLFAYRARDPKALVTAADPVGEDNNSAILSAVKDCHPVVLGWGNSIPKKCRGRVAMVLCLLRNAGVTPMCLGVTGEGQPLHPLFIEYRTPLVHYPL